MHAWLDSLHEISKIRHEHKISTSFDNSSNLLNISHSSKLWLTTRTLHFLLCNAQKKSKAVSYHVSESVSKSVTQHVYMRQYVACFGQKLLETADRKL